MPEFRGSEISGTQGWIGPWVPALGLTPSAGMTMRRWSLRFDQVGICSGARLFEQRGARERGGPDDGRAFGDLRIGLVDIDVDAGGAPVLDQGGDIRPPVRPQPQAGLGHLALQAHMNGDVAARQDGGGLCRVVPLPIPEL